MKSVRDIDSLYNFIGYVVIYAPDRFPHRDFRGDEQMNLERAFVELRRGIEFVEADTLPLGKRTQLEALLQDSLEAYRAGNDIQGAHRLQDFQDQIFKSRGD